MILIRIQIGGNVRKPVMQTCSWKLAYKGLALIALAFLSASCRKAQSESGRASNRPPDNPAGFSTKESYAPQSGVSSDHKGVFETYAERTLEEWSNRGFGELQQAVKKDPAKAIAWLKKTGQGRLTQAEAMLRSQVFYFLADQKGVENMAIEQLLLRERLSEINMFFGELAVRDPKMSIDLLSNSNLSAESKASGFGNIALLMSKSDPVGALALLDQTRPEISAHYTGTIFSNWLRQDPEGAIAALEVLQPGKLNLLLKNYAFSQALEEQDVGVSVRCLNAISPTKENLKVFEDILAKIGARDIGAALGVLSNLPQGAAKNSFTSSTFAAAYVHNPEQALREIKNLPPDQAMFALRGVISKVAVRSLDEALTMADQINGPENQDIYREIARTSALQRPESAVKILEDAALSQKIGPDFRQEMLNATVATWAKQDLQAAQQWVEKLPSNDAPKGVQGLMTSWMKSDPVAASGWLSTQPAGAARDAGAQVLISQIKDTDPEMAEQWRKTLAPEVKK